MITLGLTEAMREAALEKAAEEARRRQQEATARQQAAQQAAFASHYYQSQQVPFNPYRTYQRRPSFTVTFEQGYEYPVFVEAAELPEWVGVLGVAPSASRADIEHAYRRLVKSAHPDAGGTQEAMIILNRAIAAARLARPS